MKTKTQIQTVAPAPVETLSVKIFGVGNAGVGMLEAMRGDDFADANFTAINTDAPSLAASSALVKIHLETGLLRGLGTGGDPERGRALAEEQFATLKTACDGAEVIMIVTGLGGGAGTGISPVLARAAKEAGALTLAFVTLPFVCEGNRRQQQAQQGLNELKAVADGVICLPSQKVFKLIDENTSVLDTFRITGGLLLESVRGVWRLLTRPGLIQIHFDDLRALVRDRHAESVFASIEAAGAARSRGIVEKLLVHPLLDEGRVLAESDAVLVSLMGGPDLTMAEVNRVMEQISRQCERAQIIMGAAVDEVFKGRLSVTVIATKQNAQAMGVVPGGELSNGGMAGENFSEQPVRRNITGSASRCMPPPSPLTLEQREQMVARHAGGRGRKAGPKMRQAQLPLVIVSKGRFDKSQPTIHKGEDLDIPTYMRHGVPLN
jgi:cell division protein FtsZ